LGCLPGALSLPSILKQHKTNYPSPMKAGKNYSIMPQGSSSGQYLDKFLSKFLNRIIQKPFLQ
ncbi:hypothetical protein PJP07_29895, partial [Mycobacterium kansasii]